MAASSIAAVVVFLNSLAGIILCSGLSVDLTLRRDAMGADVVRSVQSKMDDSNVFGTLESQVYQLFMRELAYVESVDGAEYPLGIPDGGIWKFSRDLFEQTQRYSHPKLFDSICRFFCIKWSTMLYDDLRIPLYSGLAVRIYLFHLHTMDHGLPDTATDTDRATFWVSYFGDSKLTSRWLSRVDQLRGIDVCRVNTDVMFVLDSSGSIGSSNYQLVKDYVYNFTEGLFSGDSDSRVGVILFSDSANVEIDFEHANGSQNLLEEIRNLRYLNSGTNTPEGLCLLQSMPWRESLSVLRIAIVLTDGRANKFSTHCRDNRTGRRGTVNSTAEAVHNLMPPVIVFAIGVANYVLAELNEIATTPDLVDELYKFDNQLLLQNQLSRTYFICFKETQSVTVGEEQRGTAKMDTTTRLEFSSPADEGVSIKICIDQGVIVIYGSYSHSNPNAALHDFSEMLKAAEGEVVADTCHSIYASLADINRESESCTLCSSDSHGRTAREEELAITVYITIEGRSEVESQFSVNSSLGDVFGTVTDSSEISDSTSASHFDSLLELPFIISIAAIIGTCVLGCFVLVVVIIAYYVHKYKVKKRYGIRLRNHDVLGFQGKSTDDDDDLINL